MVSSNMYSADHSAADRACKMNQRLVPVSKEMRVAAATYPPLGQVSVVSSQEITFTTVLGVPSPQAQELWEISLWYSINGGEWSEAQNSRIPEGQIPWSPRQEPSSYTRLYSSVTLVLTGECSFTLKFRPRQDEPWRWVRDELGMGDGTVIVRTAPSAGSSTPSIADIVKNLNPRWTVVPEQSQAPKTKLWSASVTVAKSEGENSSQDMIPLGLPWGNFLRWFSLARVTRPWIAPIHGRARFDLALDGVVCSFLSPEGQHLVVLAVSGLRGIVTALRADETGNVVIRARNDSPTDERATVLISVGDDFSRAMAAVMYKARDLVSAPGANVEVSAQDLPTLTPDVEPQWREDWYDGLGYCTWNALGQDLTDQKLFDALEKLAAMNIKISNLIIDDNWQSIDYSGEGLANRRWLEFEADRSRFPRGLKGTVSHIREKHPHIQHVAVWHALFGYWGGISPEGAIAKEYETIAVHRRYNLGEDHKPDGPITTVSENDVGRLYNDFYRFLSSCGVDGVKTDAQFLLDTLSSATARRDLTNPYLDAWNIASLRHFGSGAISCMSLTPQTIFHSQLPRNRPAFVCRNSDDFCPADTHAAHTWHVWANAYNSLLTRHLNVLPDWDMFQTAHGYSAFHAAARCVSGGPIYITDAPGEHDVGLIGEMTATTVKGKTVILRPSVLARAIDPYVSHRDDVLLKVGSYNGSSQTGTPILAIFNTSTRPLTELLPLYAFPGLADSSPYVIACHSSRKVSGPLTVGESGSLLALSLDVGGYEILTAHPLTAVGEERLANLGLRGKMTGAAAISSSVFSATGNNRVLLDTSLKALGTLGVYISHLPSLTIADDFIATIWGRVIPPATVSVSPHCDRVLEVDVERAWAEVGAPVGWGNEVDVRVYFTLRKSCGK